MFVRVDVVIAGREADSALVVPKIDAWEAGVGSGGVRGVRVGGRKAGCGCVEGVGLGVGAGYGWEVGKGWWLDVGGHAGLVLGVEA